MLVDYLYWMRDRVLREAAELEAEAFLESPKLHRRDLRATLAHELDVELCWRARLRGEPPEAWGPEAEPKPEEFPTVAALADRWRLDEAEMRAWLAGLTPDDLDRAVTVNDLDGRSLAMYLLHVIQHGVTEFAAASAILGELDHEITDMSVLTYLEEIA
jgi:uncharacterized damage-inducible protein DinB